MRFGITGRKKTGKTTVFNLLTGMHEDTGKFSATVEQVHRGAARVPDERLDRLAELFSSKKTVPVTIDFLDFAGISLGGEREGKLVGEMRTLDALVHVLRAFDDDELPMDGGIHPSRDADNFLSELILNDLVVVESRIERVESQLGKMKNDELLREKALLERVKTTLEDDIPLRDVAFDPNDAFTLRGFGFLSMKPLLFALNVGEDEAAELNSAVENWNLQKLAGKKNVEICPLCAGIEEEISQLEDEERQEFMDDLGIEELGSIRLLKSAFKLLGLISFFTGSEKDSHAWAIPAGSNAVEAAGAIHSDLAKGFIRADVVHYDDLIEAGSIAEARKQGTFHLEGRDYVVQDGDYVLVRFNV